MQDAKSKPVHPDDHKTNRIVVNGTPHTVADETVSYDQVVELAELSPEDAPAVEYWDAIDRGDGHGELHRGQTVKVKDGTTFNVKTTRNT